MEHVAYAVEDRIGIITISRPSALNMLNSQVLNELDSTLDQADTDMIRVLTLTRAGEKTFVAGADISKMAGSIKEEGRAFGRRGNRILCHLETFPIPIIAAVNGFALGGGCELTLSCDMCICSDNVVFGQPEAGLGVMSGSGDTQGLVQTVSVGMAKQPLYTARPIKAERTYRIGLVNAAYPRDELMVAARKLAGYITRNTPTAVRNCKRAVNDGPRTDTDRALAMEEILFGNYFETKDQEGGMGALLEKREERNFINQQETGNHQI